jgi:hypothetical protein
MRTNREVINELSNRDFAHWCCDAVSSIQGIGSLRQITIGTSYPSGILEGWLNRYSSEDIDEHTEYAILKNKYESLLERLLAAGINAPLLQAMADQQKGLSAEQKQELFDKIKNLTITYDGH